MCECHVLYSVAEIHTEAFWRQGLFQMDLRSFFTPVMIKAGAGPRRHTDVSQAH